MLWHLMEMYWFGTDFICYRPQRHFQFWIDWIDSLPSHFVLCVAAETQITFSPLLKPSMNSRNSAISSKRLFFKRLFMIFRLRRES